LYYYARIKMQGKKQEINGVSALRLQGRAIVVQELKPHQHPSRKSHIAGKEKRGLVDLGVTLICSILSGTD
jgi:hypothetical protein